MHATLTGNPPMSTCKRTYMYIVGLNTFEKEPSNTNKQTDELNLSFDHHMIHLVCDSTSNTVERKTNGFL